MLFDVGHGATSFAWRIAVPAIKEGFLPDVISTDLHVASMSGGMKDMANVMSKFLALGLPFDEVIRTDDVERGARGAAGRARPPDVGASADVAVWRIEKGSVRIRRRSRYASERHAEDRCRAHAARRQGCLRSERTGSNGMGTVTKNEKRKTKTKAKNEKRKYVVPTFRSANRRIAYEIESTQVPDEVHCRRRRGRAAGGRAGADDRRREAGEARALRPAAKPPEKPPLFSGIVTFGNMVFIAGIGAHFEGDIKAHTKHVLDEIEKRLLSVGSSMDKVLKVNVYLNDLKDYAGMNEAYLGRFGAEPPVRTTIAAAGGIPGNSLVEIDCIASI